MKKRIISLCLALAVLLVALPIWPAFAEDAGKISTKPAVWPEKGADKIITNFEEAGATLGNIESGQGSYNPNNKANAIGEDGTTINAAIVDGALKMEYTAIEPGKYANLEVYTDTAQGQQITADTKVLAFHLDTTGVAAQGEGGKISFRLTLDLSNGYSGNSPKAYLLDGEKYYFQADGTNEKVEMTTRAATSIWDCFLDVDTGVSGTYYIPVEAFIVDGNNQATNDGACTPDMWNTFITDSAVSWRHNSAISFNLRDTDMVVGDVLKFDDFRWEIAFPNTLNYQYVLTTQDFADFTPNFNWTWNYGNISGYSNDPSNAVGADEYTVKNGRFAITPNATAKDGTRFTTTIDELGDWNAAYEAFVFDLDISEATESKRIRMKMIGRNLVVSGEGENATSTSISTTFEIAKEGASIYFIGDDNSVSPVLLDGKPNTQLLIPAGFKGKVVIPKAAILPAVDNANTDFDESTLNFNDAFTEFGFQFEILNWLASDNGASIYLDNMGYYTNTETTIDDPTPVQPEPTPGPGEDPNPNPGPGEEPTPGPGVDPTPTPTPTPDPTPENFTYKVAKIFQDFNNWTAEDILGTAGCKVTTHAHLGQGEKASFELVKNGEDQALKMIRKAGQNYATINELVVAQYIPDANGIAFHVDATAAATNFGVRIFIPIAGKTAFSWCGQPYYFVEDGKDDTEFVKKTISGGTNQWDSWVILEAGKSGTYFIPLTSFQAPDGVKADAGYDFKVADGIGKTIESIQFQVSGVSDDALIIDDLAWTTVDGSWNPPVVPDLGYKPAKIFQDFNKWNNTTDVSGSSETGSKVTTWKHNNEGEQPTFELVTDGEDQALKMNRLADQNFAVINDFIVKKYIADANGISFYYDGTKAKANVSIRITFGCNGKTGFSWFGNPYYFVEEGKAMNEYTEKMIGGSDQWSSWLSLTAGKAGTYFIPFSAFEIPASVTVDEKNASYDFDYAASVGEVLTGITFQVMSKSEDPFIIDDLAFTTADGSWNEPPAPPLFGVIANICVSFDDWKNLDGVSTWKHNNKGEAPTFELVASGDGKALKMNRKSEQSYAVVKLPDNNCKYVAEANGIVVHIDNTANPQNAMLRMSFRSGEKSNQTWFGNKYYFVEDGKDTTQYEELIMPGSHQWSSWVNVLGGKSGTYYIPLKAFEVPEGATDVDAQYDFKVADRVNKTVESVTFQFSGISEYPIYLDDIGFTTPDGTWVVPPQDPFPYMFSNTFVNFRAGDLLLNKDNGEGSVGCWGTINADEHFTFENNRLKVKFGKSESGKETALSFGAKNQVYSDDKALSFTVDASRVGCDLSVRGTMGIIGESAYRNTGGGGIYYLIPADGSDYIEKTCAGERFTIPAGFKGTVVLPFESFNGGGSDNLPAKPTGKQLSRHDRISLSLYIYDVTTRNNTLVFSKFNIMKPNDGTGPITGVEDNTIAVIGLLLAAAFVGGYAVKKGLKVVED